MSLKSDVYKLKLIIPYCRDSINSYIRCFGINISGRSYSLIFNQHKKGNDSTTTQEKQHHDMRRIKKDKVISLTISSLITLSLVLHASICVSTILYNNVV